MIQGQEDGEPFDWEDTDYGTSQHENAVEWMSTPTDRNRSWHSDFPGNYLVMTIRLRKHMKVVVAKLSIKSHGQKRSVWIDSGSPISIFTTGESEILRIRRYKN